MILQFFPRVTPVRDSVFGVNTLGMLEIFPKPSGITVYSHPTTMSTHAVRDEFISKGPEYDHTGFKLLEHDDGCECLIISNAMRGGYKQIGLQPRDPYTRRNNPAYVPPNARNPPRPWSVRLKEPRLRPIEICYTRAGMVNAFLGKEGDKEQGYGKDVTRNLRAEEVGAPANIVRQKVRDLWRVTQPDHAMTRGNLKIDPSKTPYTQDFVCNVFMVARAQLGGGDHPPFSVLFPSSRVLGDTFIKNYTKTLAPASIVIPACPTKFLPSPIRPTTPIYANVFDYYVPWRESIVDKTVIYSLVYLSPDCMTRYDAWINKTSPKSQVIPTACEFPMDWLVVVAQFTEKPLKADNSPYPPVLFVPHILAFHPINGSEGPIDSRTGRRLCNGECLMAYLTTSPVVKMFPPNTRVALNMYQISRPITNAAFFSPPVDLSKLLGIDIGDDQRLAMMHEDEMVAEAVQEDARIKHEAVRHNKEEKMEEEIIAKK